MAGIYIHIPFCKQACNYCNFHFTTSARYKADIVAAIIKEITLTPLFHSPEEEIIETVYIGGGTPSLLTGQELCTIVAALHHKFSIAGNAEITLEANPDDVNIKALAQWQTAGINRLSMGIQSFDEAELKWMNRAHTAEESMHCLEEIKNAGFTNYSIDLIYGSPLLTIDNWKRNVEIVIEKQVPHISCYALTVEPKTALSKMITQKKRADVDANKQSQQFLLLMQWMRTAGYEHYEISNYALPGMRSQHNSSYWQGKKYYGFGPSAHSYDGNNRRWNIANNNLYLQSLQKGVIPFEEETLTTTQRLNEYIMTSLRTVEGLNIEKVKHEFGETFSKGIVDNAKKYLDSNKLFSQNVQLTLTDEGKLFADGIAADLFY